MIDFIVKNYQLLLLVFACLIEIVVFVFTALKKSKKDLPVMEQIYGLIPIAVRAAEDIFGKGNGEKKFDYVMTYCKKLYHQYTGQDFADGSLTWRTIECVIENVLAAPQKKGK